MKRWINKLKLDPKRLFLLDGLGACMTALIFCGLLIPFHQVLGMPVAVLQWLLLIAIVFAIYSLSCFFFLENRRLVFLKIIAVGNSMYCLLTLFFVILYFRELALISVIYFLLEITVIAGLVYLELKTPDYGREPHDAKKEG